MRNSKFFSVNTSETFSVNKGFAAILILGLVVAILGLVIVAAPRFLRELAKTCDVKPCYEEKSSTSTSNPQDETANPDFTPIQSELIGANWKTYRNTEYGYSVKYPPNWYFYEFKIILMKDFQE